jgi:hypothetical protein
MPEFARQQPGQRVVQLESATFRFNPGLELVLYDRLESGLRARLADLNRDPSFYGILLPADRASGAGSAASSSAPSSAPSSAASAAASSTTARAVDRESALLLLTLRTPGLIPIYARRLLGPHAWHTITGLVLDGVLEIETAGTFRSGPAALDALTRDGDVAADDMAPSGHVARLSLDALHYAAALPIDDIATLARRLYAYNRLPVTPANAAPALLTTDLARLGFIATGNGNAVGVTSAVSATLDRHWTYTPSDGEWLSWSSPERWAAIDTTHPTCKLYVSPAPTAIADAFAATVAAATTHGALAFKVGAGPYGLLRPDKLVMYFRDRAQLFAAATALTAALAGAPAHGVPFTAALTENGMLSWAADPPEHVGLVGWTTGTSWRSWLTTQLAGALIAGRTVGRTMANGEPDRADPVRFALHRAAALRIDPRTWTAADPLWRSAAS